LPTLETNLALSRLCAIFYWELNFFTFLFAEFQDFAMEKPQIAPAADEKHEEYVGQDIVEISL